MKVNQTLEQRRRNALFAKKQQGRMGKSDPDSKNKLREKPKPTISPVWIGLLAFVVMGGLLFELIAMFTR